jgi:peptidoglycan/xylan/chitin deacetylase (PgdA/CDA1 family)
MRNDHAPAAPARFATKARAARALVTAGALLVGMLALASAAQARPTYVSLTFDDGTASQASAVSSMDAHGMRGTFYVNSGEVGSDPYFMDWPEIQAIASAGHEIGGHTATHPDLTTLTAATQALEICGDREALQAHGYDPVSFAYPFAKHDATSRALTQSCGYTSARGVGNVGCLPGCAPAETLPPPDPTLLRTAAGVTDTTSLAELQGYVTNAVDNGGGWLILVFHTFCDNCADTNSMTAADFDALLDFIQGQAANGVSVKTVREAMAIPPAPPPPNVLRNASLENAITSAGPDCWTRASFAGASGGGSVGSWSNTSDAHSGANAERIDITSFSDGDHKLVSTQDPVLAIPSPATATASVIGGSLPARTYYYKVTATSAAGETPPTGEVSVTTSGIAASVAVTWVQQARATGYRIYRAGSPGTETLLATVGAVGAYSDTGAVTPGSAVPPSVNTAVTTTACSPAAAPGHIYQAGVWYKTSVGANLRLVAYYRDAAGVWQFWREQPLPASTTWTRALWQTPKVPAGALALSLGFSLRSVGSATMDDFSLGDLDSDYQAPFSSATSAAYSTSPNITVSYTAADEDAGSGVATVDLYAKAPGQSSYAKVQTDATPSSSGSFHYVAGAVDGAYSFYTVAADHAGNRETTAAGQTTTVVDSVAPSSSATSPATSASTTITVSYAAADDAGGSGLSTVDLYAKAPGESDYTRVATGPAPGASGSFGYAASGGDGSYSFYTVATDKAGNLEADPWADQTTTVLDTVAPVSAASSPATSKSTALTVDYTASDAGSGLSEVRLYAKGPGDSAYAKVATDATPAASDSFSYTAGAGDGEYRLYAVAVDRAGNGETTSTAQTTTLLDTVAPTSTASSPATTKTSALTVSYTASDGGSGLSTVDLYAKAPGTSAFGKVMTDANPPTSGFSYAAADGDGAYSFYAVATDVAGNREATSTGQTTTVLDTTAPVSAASSPATSTTTALTVAYTASDAGTGLATVDLYAKGPGEGAYAKVRTTASPGSAGSFSYTAAAGDGSYSFYTVATDRAANQEAAPSTADATTTVDTVPPDTVAPHSSATSPPYSTSTTMSVSYTASDTSGSGVATVELWAKAPAASVYTKAKTDTAPGASGSFGYTATGGDGSYRFYTVATDRAGNRETTSTPQATTLLDTIVPASAATSPAYSTSTTMSVTYTASDAGSGLATIELWAKAPGASAYTQASTDTTPSASESFGYTAAAGNGSYSFYTVATDKAGKRQAAPSTPQATTLLDTVVPTSAATSPAYSTSTAFSVAYTAADTGGSGVATVELWAKTPTQTAFAKLATATAPGASGSFGYTAAAGDGSYRFYTVATDKAGKRETTSAAQATTVVDTLVPVSAATSPAFSTSAALTVNYTASDAGSGLASVELYAKAPAASAYTKVSTDTTPSAAESFSYNAAAGNGSYGFYTVATDKVGRRETTVAAQTTTILDTVVPTAQNIRSDNAGGTDGKADTGDTVTFTFSEAMSPVSIVAAWTGASTQVLVKLVDASSSSDTLQVWSADNTARLAVANPLALNGDYVPSSGAIFKATMVLDSSGTGLTVTLSSLLSGSVKPASSANFQKNGPLKWTPDARATDRAGNHVNTTPLSKSGTAF